MTAPTTTHDLRALKGAWAQLCNAGTASPTIAKLLQVGIKPFLEAFEAAYLGPDNVGQGSKIRPSCSPRTCCAGSRRRSP
jgi:hypothetical protein